MPGTGWNDLTYGLHRMILPQPREGEILRIKERPLEFSFWPVERTTRRYGLGSRVFATDPWTVIRRSAEIRCTAATKDSAFSLIEQAEDFYKAADSGVKAAKPLLLYYCYMNLAKAYILASQQQTDVNNAQHGLSEQLDIVPNPVELVNAFLNAYPSPNRTGQLQNFSELLSALTGSGVALSPHRFDLPKLMPQVVPGHRLWVQGNGKKTKERFLAIERIEFRHNSVAKTIWLRIYLFADDLRRIDITHKDALTETRVGNLMHDVVCNDAVDDRPLVCFEQTAPVTYTGRPSDDIPKVVSQFRHLLWRTVLITPPYRKYYLYASPPSEHGQALPQIISIYAITYYLGSIVRYRPHHFDRILQGKFGPFIEAFLNDQPKQFIYLLASEFAEKEVTKAAIV